jgi:hypothetical protein
MITVSPVNNRCHKVKQLMLLQRLLAKAILVNSVVRPVLLHQLLRQESRVPRPRRIKHLPRLIILLRQNGINSQQLRRIAFARNVINTAFLGGLVSLPVIRQDLQQDRHLHALLLSRIRRHHHGKIGNRRKQLLQPRTAWQRP